MRCQRRAAAVDSTSIAGSKRGNEGGVGLASSWTGWPIHRLLICSIIETI
jgi:hypothetical protein